MRCWWCGVRIATQGLEVITASRLPMGSGLGGSSVLSGVLLHAVGVAVGRQYDTSSLVHAVLKLEQMLSSGGGWQVRCLPARLVASPLHLDRAQCMFDHISLIAS